MEKKERKKPIKSLQEWEVALFPEIDNRRAVNSKTLSHSELASLLAQRVVDKVSESSEGQSN